MQKLPAWAVMPKARVKAAFKGQQGCTLKAVHARYAQLCAQVSRTADTLWPHKHCALQIFHRSMHVELLGASVLQAFWELMQCGVEQYR